MGVKGHLPTCLLPVFSPSPNPNSTHTHLPLRHPPGQERHSFSRTRCEALLTTGRWGGKGTGSSERHPAPHPAPTGRRLLGCKGSPVALLDQAQGRPPELTDSRYPGQAWPPHCPLPSRHLQLCQPSTAATPGGVRGSGQRAAPGQTNPDFPASLSPWGVQPTATWRPWAPVAQLSVGVIAKAWLCPATHVPRASP